MNNFPGSSNSTIHRKGWQRNLDTMKPRYRKHILPFIILRFHCIVDLSQVLSILPTPQNKFAEDF